MSRSFHWVIIALVVSLSVSFSSQQPTPPTASKPAPPPAANSSNGAVEPELKIIGSLINRWFPSFALSAVPQPLKQSEQQTQLPVTSASSVITSPAFQVVAQPRPVLFQAPEPFSPFIGFQGHAAYFQKMRQEEMQRQQLMGQYIYAHRLQAFQQQHAELQQMIQAKQFLQQMHPTVRQWFQQMSPLVQFNMFQQYLKYQKLEPANNQISNQRNQIYLPEARIGQRHQEQSSTTESSSN